MRNDELQVALQHLSARADAPVFVMVNGLKVPVVSPVDLLRNYPSGAEQVILSTDTSMYAHQPLRDDQ